jgi:hypothetical protein
VIAVIIIILISALSPSGSRGALVPYQPAPTSYVKALASITPAQLTAAGIGGGQESPEVFVPTPKQSAITAISQGKKVPVLVYMGAEYCPFCGASRWPLIIALDRFGSFTGLGTIGSSPDDVYASTRTFSFAKAKYSSPYLVFDPTEFTTNVCAVAIVSNGCPNANYTHLQTPSSRDEKLFTTYDGAPYFTASTGGIPFLDWAGKYVSSGSLYQPNVITLGDSTNSLGWHPLTWQEIITALSVPTSGPGQAILGAANLYTAAICQMTGGQPASVCTTPTITQATAELPK